MRTVNISDLKAQLSTHIQLVRDGEEVLVCDRNKLVARIVPVRLEDRPEQEQRLVARGVLAPPLKKRPKSTELGRLRVVQCNCYATAPLLTCGI